MGALGVKGSGGGTPMKNAKEKFIELELKIEKTIPMKSKLDVLKGNRATTSLIKIFKYFEENREEAEQILIELLEHENCFVHTGAAARCLALGMLTSRALEVLEEVAQNPTKRTRFEAEGVLKVYGQQGYLRIYQGQKIYKSEES